MADQEKIKKILTKAKQLKEEKEVGLAKEFMEVAEQIGEVIEKVNEVVESVNDAIADIEFPEQKDESENFKALMDKLNEPQEITVELNIV